MSTSEPVELGCWRVLASREGQVYVVTGVALRKVQVAKGDRIVTTLKGTGEMPMECISKAEAAQVAVKLFKQLVSGYTVCIVPHALLK